MDTTDFYQRVQADERESRGYVKPKIEFILNHAGSGNIMLDIGCNDGYISGLLLEKGNTVYGVDIVPKNILTAKKRGIKAKYCNIEKTGLPYKNDFFDVVLIGDVIEHVFETDAILDECYRVLKKNGKLILTTPNVASFGRRFMLLFGYNPFLEYSNLINIYGHLPVGHIRYYTKKTLEKQLLYHKFRNIHIYGDSLNFYFKSFMPAPEWLSSFAVDLNCVAIK